MQPWFTGLPLYRDPAPEESAAGLLLHLAEVNGYNSSLDFVAGLAGLKRTALMIGDAEHIRTFATAIECDPARLAADTVQSSVSFGRNGRKTISLSIRGIPISNRIHSISERRVCPECLIEKRQHRFWWELTAIGTCPRHKCELRNSCECGHPFSWRDAALYRCPQCFMEDPGTLSQRAAAGEHLAKDTYLLSRFHAAECSPIPILDQLPVYEAVATMERVGAAALGYHQTWQNAKRLGMQERELQQAGFAILKEGRLNEVLDRLWGEYKASGQRTHDGFTTAYGWFYHWFNCKGGRAYSPLLAEAFLAHGAERFSLNSNVRLGHVPAQSKRKLSLKEAAARCDSSVFAMRNIGLLLGVLRERKRPGVQHSLPAEVVDRIAGDLRRSCTLQEARRKLGIGNLSMHDVLRNQLLVPKLEGGKRHKHVYVFSRDEVDALVERLAQGAKSVRSPSEGLLALDRRGIFGGGTAKLIRCILEGKLHVRERVRTLPGLRGMFVAPNDISNALIESDEAAAIPASTAARKMRLNAPGLKKAIDSGLIKAIQKNGRLFISRPEIDRFRAEYVMLVEMTERTKQNSKRVVRFLAKREIQPVPQIEKCGLVGFRRRKVEPLLERVAKGELSLEPEESYKASLLRAVTRRLKAAHRPVPSKDLIKWLRDQGVRLGPSDTRAFFYSTLWESSDTIVSIPSAGWWLKNRPFAAACYGGDGGASDQFERVTREVLKILSAAEQPVPPERLLDVLDGKGIVIVRSDKRVFIRQLVARNRDKIAKLTGLGYWPKDRHYAPAKYDPKLYPNGIQTKWQRIGAIVSEYLEAHGHPAGHKHLCRIIEAAGLLDRTRHPRDTLNDALSRLPDRFIHLREYGYWLRSRPYAPAGYWPHANGPTDKAASAA